MSTTNSNTTRALKYRGATIEDLDPPPALSLSPSSPISLALQAGFERDYTHLTIISSSTRALLGYISIPRLKSLLESKTVKEEDEVGSVMLRFRRKEKVYTVITPDTPLEVLEEFFEGQEEDFAVVTDEGRKFVLGVVTRGDLEEFVRRRAA